MASTARSNEAWRIVVQTAARARGEGGGVEPVGRRLGVVERPPGRGEIRRPIREHAFDGTARGIDLRLDRGRIAEDDLRLGVREGEAGRRCALPRRRRKRAGGEPQARHRENAEECEAPHGLLGDLHLQPGRRLRHLTRDRGRPLLGRATEGVGLLRREPLSVRSCARSFAT